jgi:hypothetical protein
MSLDAQRFVYNGQPVYNRFNLMSDIAENYIDHSGENYVFDIVLETVRILEDKGIIETVEGPAAELFVVQNWEKML